MLMLPPAVQDVRDRRRGAHYRVARRQPPLRDAEGVQEIGLTRVPHRLHERQAHVNRAPPVVCSAAWDHVVVHLLCFYCISHSAWNSVASIISCGYRGILSTFIRTVNIYSVNM